MAYEEIEVQSDSISKPTREVIVEYIDTIVVPQEQEVIETEVC